MRLAFFAVGFCGASQDKLKKTTLHLAVNAAVAAMYVALTVPFGALATNPFVQIRPGEALTVLPIIMPYTVWGLTVGCMIGNVTSAFGLWDILLGALVTFVAAVLTSKMKRDFLAPIPPMVLNALLLPLVWLITAPVGIATYLLQVAGLLVSQGVACFGLGLPLLRLTRKRILPLLNES